jgi:hypothetical protein
MAILVRSLVKVLLFVGLFLLLVRLVHIYPYPMTNEQLRWWFAVSAKFGIRDPEDLEVSVTLVANLILTFFLYMGVLKLWKSIHTRYRTSGRG